jgi:hypothetical protein
MRKTIDLRDTNQFCLYKQHLTRDSKVYSKDLVEAVLNICGLHSQVASTPYLSMWNRVTDFHNEDLSGELYDKRTLVKTWGVRATLHIVPTSQVVEYYQATKKVKGRLLLFKLEPIHKKIIEVLNEVGALTTQELTNYIPELSEKIQTRYGDMSLGQWNLRQMCQSTVLIPVKPKGNWTSNLHTYINFQQWLPSIDLQVLDEREAKMKIIYYYLSCFEPVMIDDIAWWIGITKGEVKQILEEMDDKVDWHAPTKDTTSYVRVKDSLASGAGGR